MEADLKALKCKGYKNDFSIYEYNQLLLEVHIDFVTE